MSTEQPEAEHDREYKRENYRTCGICRTPVDGGTDGIVPHLAEEHSAEEIATEVSHRWAPHEPMAVHLPNGTVHFVESVDNTLATTPCGRTLSVGDYDDIESMMELSGYEHAEADDYCGSCVSLTRRKHGRDFLPDPLQEVDR